MTEQRDQWAETAKERHARILARNLAWMTYAEACARDGVPRSERDHLIFNDGYAAGRADYLPAEGIVAEEPETVWQWCYVEKWEDGTGVYERVTFGTEGDARRWLTDNAGHVASLNFERPRGDRVVASVEKRRTYEPGEWVPVKQEGADGA